jgi:hypothetical protein
MKVCARIRGYSAGVAAAFILTAALFGVSAPAVAAELVMFGSPHCPWCEAWESEVGAIYPKTAEGRLAPLWRVDIDQPRPPELAEIDRVVFTPTFVLLVEGREVGRILGYPGEAHFWGLLGSLLRK